MPVYRWFLPTLSEVLAQREPEGVGLLESVAPGAGAGPGGRDRRDGQRRKAEQQWRSAIAALEQLLAQQITQAEDTAASGVVLCGPTAVLPPGAIAGRLPTYIFSSEPLHLSRWMRRQLMPSEGCSAEHLPQTPTTLPLLPDDPLHEEQFCLVHTPSFSLVMLLGETPLGEPGFLFSFNPETVQWAWNTLRARALMVNPEHGAHLDALGHALPWAEPHYHVVTRFSRELLHHQRNQAEEAPEVVTASTATSENGSKPSLEQLTEDCVSPDVELLQAIAHEVRTPLATIRTFTRSLLRRRDLPPEVLKRLETIDHECTEQIDRFNLIFRAAELEVAENKQTPLGLAPTPLADVFQQGIPRWQKQASRRNLTLDVLLPNQMPTVVSDPTMLDQALTGLIERFTRNLPAGSHINVQVRLAGSQLKLQLQSQECSDAELDSLESHSANLRSLGQLLMFQPETGSLSLNLAVTKNLFHALGGKLIVRQRPRRGEVLTVFLPLEKHNPSVYTV
ncbi:histidine kinase [Geitlerinema sp. PCC 7407]|nr:histidine kinase [Geitlerinema sp. PCC 7407]